MSTELDRIHSFISQHHVLSLATHYDGELSVCSLFYAYVKNLNFFIVASNDDTTHIQHIKKNTSIAGNILLETKIIGKIQGLQFRGNFLELKDIKLEKEYFKQFPHAKIMNPKLWKIQVHYFKMTDNTLGFAKKIIWQDSLA